MARYFGHKSRYSRFLSIKYISYFFGTLMIMVVLGLVLGRLGRLSGQPIFSLILILGFLFIAAVGPEIAKVFEKRSDKVDRGSWGESSVRRILLRLPNTYSVFEDVVVNKFGNIDFVVVGPSGVFVIEVKSHYGSLGFNGIELTNRGRAFEKNFLSQTWGEKKSLEEFLKQKGINIQIIPVLVFTKARMRFGFNPLKGVHVIGKDLLLRLIESHQGHIYQQGEIEKLINFAYKS